MGAEVGDHPVCPRGAVKTLGGGGVVPNELDDVPEVGGPVFGLGSKGSKLDLDVGKRGAVGVGCPEVAVLFPVASGKVFL